MAIISKILIPIDFSERCLGAARFAIPLAERFHSEITLLHVAPAPGPDWNVNAEREERANRQLRDFLCAAFAHLDAKRVLREGSPAQEIVAYAREDQSDLIMMPTRGYGAFRQLLLGSVTAKVLHDADCPVWTGAHLAKGPSAEWINPTTILCAADANPGSEKALVWASQLASELDAALLLVHVDPRLKPANEEDLEKYQHKILADSNRRMEELQSAAGTRAQVFIEPGNIPRAVSAAAEHLDADLLVIGRGSGRAPGRLGLNTYGIIRESRCPVVSV
ncbi:MAG: universal stress protein [Bryobacteraceae bacterium]